MSKLSLAPTIASSSHLLVRQPVLEDGAKVRPGRVVKPVLAIGCLLGLLAFWQGGSSDFSPSPTCWTVPQPLALAPETTVTMSVKGGLACPLWVRLASAHIDALDITAAPQHGTLTPRGRTGVIYHPNRGYKGADVFTFAMHGGGTFYSGPAIVHANVTVK